MALGGLWDCGALSEVGYIGEQGVIFVRRLPHEVGGVPREDVCDVVFLLGAVGYELTVLVELVVVILETPRLSVPLVPARW